jgi:predicted DNA-binding transcriptional regulator AlpA
MPPLIRQFITLAETANLARVTTHTLAVWRKDPENSFPKPIRLTNRTIRYDLAEIEAWLATRRAHAWVDRVLTDGESTASEAV